MKSWATRTREEAHLLNPAFCCVTITSACAGYNESNGQPLPFALGFMVLPIILHKHTRESLPRTSRTSMPAWLQEHAEARLGFHERLTALRPHTREAMYYGLAFDWIAMGDSGVIRCVGPDTRINRAVRSLDGDARDCASRARFLGKWLGTTASTETTMALWGIRP
ncbi:MAG: three component ABC system middle component [bacterium]